MVRYQSRRGDDADLRDAIKTVAKERRRFGYRRLQVMVERQGWQVAPHLGDPVQLAAEVVNHVQYPEPTTARQAVGDEVEAPPLVRPLWDGNPAIFNGVHS